MVPQSPLTPPDKKQLKRICSDISLSPDQLDKDVQTLKDWLKLQPHLPQDALDDVMLAAFITGCKNSLQIAKQKIDMYLTNRSLFPDLYGNRDPNRPDILQSAQVSMFFTLPGITAEGHRANITRFTDKDPDKFHFVPYIQRLLNTADVRLKSERYLGGEYLIYDFTGFSAKHFTKFTPSLLKKFIYCGEDSMPLRQKGVFIINAPPIAETLVNIIKPLLKEKSARRIHVYSGDHTNVYKYIPRQMLPEEYGGSAGKMDDLNRKWEDYVASFREWFLEDAKRTVDESKRPEKALFKPKQLFGAEGSFRKLTID